MKFVHLVFCFYWMWVRMRVTSQHSWHYVTTDDFANCQLGQAYEFNFYFTDLDGSFLNNFTVTPDSPFSYEMVSNGSDFQMLYTLSCVQYSSTKNQTPKVCFVVGADAPAQPNIQIVNYYGAKGGYKIVEQVGVNFYLYYLSERE